MGLKKQTQNLCILNNFKERTRSYTRYDQRKIRTIIKMKVTPEKNEKVANMIFGSIYPLYLNRLEKNGRTKEELNEVIRWFTGFDQTTLQSLIDEKTTFRAFFQKAKIHSNAHMIKGVVCGYRIEEIEEEFELYKQCRQMEKLIDELARGRKMEKILRKEKK